MKKIFTISRLLLAFILIATGVVAQDVSINVISQQNDVPDGNWPLDAPSPTTTVLVSICNEDGGSTSVPPFKLRPLISVPGAIVQIDAVQPGLPDGWSILSNTGSSIRLSNGTDSWTPGECREFPIVVTPIAEGGPLTVTATMGFSTGVSPGSASGPQTVGNDPSNDNSTTAIMIGAPLPVTLVSFSAQKEGQAAVLRWSTTAETNSDYFEVQHSVTGEQWAKIGNVASNGESTTLKNYTFSHDNPVNGQNLYRLKMVDKDLTFAYSKIRNIDMGDAGNVDVVYPNPVEGSLYVKNIESVSGIRIINMQGKTVYQSAAASADDFSVGHLPSGAHLVEVTRKNGSKTVQKIVIR